MEFMDVCRTTAGMVYGEGVERGEERNEEEKGLGISGVEGLFDGFVKGDGDGEYEGSLAMQGDWTVCGCKGCEKWGAKGQDIVC